MAENALPESVARELHSVVTRLGRERGWDEARDWDDLRPLERELVTDAVADLLRRGVIYVGSLPA